MASIGFPEAKPLTQKNRFLKVYSSFPEDTLLLEAFSGTEHVSSSFQFTLSLISNLKDIELKEIIGKVMKVALRTASGQNRYFNGYVTRFDYLRSEGGHTFYEAEIGPWTDFLKHEVCSRIFQEKTVLDILRKIFKDFGSMARYEIVAKDANYKPITLCVQFEESTFDFISRMMEEYGIYYYYRFEEGDHVLMIESDSLSCPKMPEQVVIDFNTESGASKSDTIFEFGTSRRLVSNHYSAKTYDFKNPRDPMSAETVTNHTMGDLPKMEWYEHPGAYAYADDKSGKDLVKLRIEEQELISKSFSGSGDVRTLTCGHFFELMKHHRLKSGDDRIFFVISVTHFIKNNYLGKQSKTSYENHFICIRKKIPFRPGRRTPKPIMRGLQTAIVTCPEGEEIFCDKYARIKIRFHWDREGKKNDQSSCWVRVATQWAGQRFGVISLPRADTEVLVDFLDGDPDRPLVTGAVFNQVSMPPWELPANKTQSGILTQSTKDGNFSNANALRFEDKKGAEEVWLHAEKDQRIEVENNETHDVGVNRTKTIGSNESSTIGINRTEQVGANETITIGANRTEMVGANETISIAGSKATTIMQAKSESVLLASTEQVGLARNLMVGGAYTIEVGAAMNTMVVGVQGTQVMMSRFVSVEKNQTTTIGGNHNEDVTNNRTMTAGDRIELTCGEASLVMKKDGTITLKGKDITVTSTAETAIKATGQITIKGQKVKGN